MSITIMLVDDHPLVRQGVHRLLETEPDLRVIAETGDGLTALEMVAVSQPDVLIVDLMMPGLSGLELTRQAVQAMPKLCVVVLSMHRDEGYVTQAVINGAKGYVLKDGSPDELITAIRQVMTGQRYLSPSLSKRLIDTLLEKTSPDKSQDVYQLLTSRERVVLQLLVEGHTNAEAARRLNISKRTVEAHRANIMRKIEANHQTDLIRFALKNGLLKID